MGGFMSGMEFTTSIMQVLVITAGGIFIMRGELDYIDLMTFSLYVSTFVTPIRKLAQFSEIYMQGTAGFTRFLELMRTEPSIKDAPDAIDLGSVKGEVELPPRQLRVQRGVRPRALRCVADHRPGGEAGGRGPLGEGARPRCASCCRGFTT